MMIFVMNSAQRGKEKGKKLKVCSKNMMLLSSIRPLASCVKTSFNSATKHHVLIQRGH